MLLQDLMKSNEDVKKLLNTMPGHIKNRSSIKLYKAGSTIIKKGEEIKYIQILCSGMLNVINEFANGSIYIIDTNKAINFIGEMEVLADVSKAVVTNIAKSDCIVVRVVKKDFIEWITDNKEVTLNLAKRLATRACHTSGYLGYSHYYPAGHMLQRFIIEYCKKEINSYDRVCIDMKRQEIAEILGISVKTVGRNVTKLREENLITVVKGKIFVDKTQYNNLISVTEIW